MTDKKTYRIDENALRDKLTSYTVSFNENSFSFLETEIAQVKPSNPIELPDTKKLVQFIGIPVAIGVLGCLVYFGVSYVKNLPPSTPKKDTVIVTKPTVAPKIEEKKEVVTPPINTNTTVVNAEVKHQGVTAPVVQTPVKVKDKKTTPVQAVVVKKDSGQQVSAVEKAKLDTVRKNKPDTISVNKDNSPKKKKKKRKNALDVTEDIKQSQPTSGEDDVVVPDSNPK
ncbi:MAG TPA: hypothetical protein VK835_05940 [Bacteroidia bacterium]|jgi:hypothetical protein|nr:hypothetical protein [Bacteroidia bacterium]